MLGTKIKRRREEYGITSQELAKLANVSQAFISQVENNRRQPSYNTLQAIAYALNTSTDYFLADTSNTPNDSEADSAKSALQHPLTPGSYYKQPPSNLTARETINLSALVDYADAIYNARCANITPEEVYEAVEALKKLKRLRR